VYKNSDATEKLSFIVIFEREVSQFVTFYLCFYRRWQTVQKWNLQRKPKRTM